MNNANYRSTFDEADDDDLEKVQEKITKVEDESLSATRRMRQNLAETREVGAKTSEQLVRQGEQLKNVDRTLDDISANLDESQKDIRKMKGIFSRIKSKFTRSDHHKVKEVKESKNVNVTKQQSKTNPDLRFNNEPVQRNQFATITGSDREKEINDDLTEISYGMNDLKFMALSMQSELETQNSLISRLDTKVEINNSKILHQDKQVKRILGNTESKSDNTEIMPSKYKMVSDMVLN